jgi:hypothetical protein
MKVDKSKIIRWVMHVERKGEPRNAYSISVGKPGGKGPLGRTTSKLEDNIKMEQREIGWDGVDWIDIDRDSDHWKARVNTVMNLRVP